MWKLPFAFPMCNLRAWASNHSGGKLALPVTGAPKRNANRGIQAGDAPSQRNRGNAKRIGPGLWFASGALPRQSQRPASELPDRSGLQYPAFVSPDRVGINPSRPRRNCLHIRRLELKNPPYDVLLSQFRAVLVKNAGASFPLAKSGCRVFDALSTTDQKSSRPT